MTSPSQWDNPITDELHGGDIVSASQHYGIAMHQWIDLSTGINPSAYPLASFDEALQHSFQQLPYTHPDFIQASTDYYGCPHFLAVSGTQAAIQQLPTILGHYPVLLPEVGYQEHRKYWQASSSVCFYPSLNQRESISFIDAALEKNNQQHLVVINPNNPTGILFDKQQLIEWSQRLAPGAYLIVDEAFIDTTPEQSVLSHSLPDNMIVLRSFGKFFGLAGIRLGYCFAQADIIAALKKRLGLWQVNGPAQTIAIRALWNRQWHHDAIHDIQQNSQAMQQVFLALLAKLPEFDCHQDSFHSLLFSSYRLSLHQANFIQTHFAQAGILLRVIPLNHQQALLRIGLCDRHNTVALERIHNVIASLNLSSAITTDSHAKQAGM